MRILSAEVSASGLGYPEGPIAMSDGRIAFVEQYRSRVSVLEGETVVPLALTGGNPNGLAQSADGMVWATRGRGVLGEWRSDEVVEPAIVVVDPATGRTETVATEADGIPLRAPNDLCVGPDRALWFTDPHDYDPDAPYEGWICRLEGDRASRVLVLGNTFPNGLAFDRDGTLYWVESIARRICRLGPTGPEVVATLPDDAIPDGCAFTSDGRLVIATLHSGAIDVVGWSEGRLESQRIHLRMGATLTNLAFQGSVLWATDVTRTWARHVEPTGRLWRYETDAEGLPLRS